jgi:hypothetical protein
LDTAIEDSGLSVANTNALISDIEGLNPKITVNSTNISRTGTVDHKSTITFEVEAVYQNSVLTSLFNRQSKNFILRYRKIFANKTIIN